MSTRPPYATDGALFIDTEVIVLTRAGVWLSDGVEITHGPTLRLFSRSLRRIRSEGTGHDAPVEWEVVAGKPPRQERKSIIVEDTPFFVTGLSGSPDTGYVLRLAGDFSAPLDPATLEYIPGRLTCKIAQPAQMEYPDSATVESMSQPMLEEAKFLSPAYFDLLQHLREDRSGYYLIIQGQRISLSTKSER